MSINELWEALGWSQRISLFMVVIGLPAAVYYPWMFSRIRFWESDIGKSMFMKGVAMASIFITGLFSVIAFMYHWHGWFQWIRAAVNALLVVAVWYQVVVMRRVQRSGMAKERLGIK